MPLSEPRPNERCPCGSGKKYKKCCGAKIEVEEPAPPASGPGAPPPDQPAVLASAEPDASAETPPQASPAGKVVRGESFVPAPPSEEEILRLVTKEAVDEFRRQCVRHGQPVPTEEEIIALMANALAQAEKELEAEDAYAEGEDEEDDEFEEDYEEECDDEEDVGEISEEDEEALGSDDDLYPDYALEEYLEELDEEEALDFAWRDHPDLRRLWRRGELPDEVPGPTGEPMNPLVHMAMHGTVERQLASDTPPGVRAAARELMALGMSRHDIRHAIGELVAGQIFGALREHKLHSEAEYQKDLHDLVERYRKEKAGTQPSGAAPSGGDQPS